MFFKIVNARLASGAYSCCEFSRSIERDKRDGRCDRATLSKDLSSAATSFVRKSELLVFFVFYFDIVFLQYRRGSSL